MTVRILQGDCLTRLAELPEQSIHCCVTSPPYYGLRDYGIEGQIGLEDTPEAFVERLVAVFREVKRVLRDDGTLWLNLGDSYGGKNLLGIPWRVAFALQADGWYLRQDIIWHKPNPMPESVTDRCTKAHEYVFLLTKQPRYYYDHEAIKEPGVIAAGTKAAKGSVERAAQPGVNGRPPEYKTYDGTRNKRSVWTVTTKPFKGAHFATFPVDLVKPMVLAGTSEKGCCVACGAPLARAVEKTQSNQSNAAKAGTVIEGKGHVSSQVRKGHDIRNGPCVSTKTTGWSPTCACGAETRPCTVLDPFAGAGTALLVADGLGRDGIGIELNPEYAEMARARIYASAPLLVGAL